MKKSGSRKWEVGSRSLVAATFRLRIRKWLLVLLSTFLPFYLSTFLYSQDMKVKLNSSDGSTSFQVRDSVAVVVSSITSDGNIHTKYGVKSATGVFTGTGATTYSITTSSGVNIQAGSFVADADDKLKISLGTTTIKGNLTVSGTLTLSVTNYVLAGNMITAYAAVSPGPDDASGIDWTNSTSAIGVWNSTTVINGRWHHPTGDCQIKIVFRADCDANDGYVTWTDGAGNWGSWVTVPGGTAGYTSFEGSWENLTWTTTRNFSIQMYTSNAASWIGVQKAWLLIRPQQ